MIYALWTVETLVERVCRVSVGILWVFGCECVGVGVVVVRGCVLWVLRARFVVCGLGFRVSLTRNEPVAQTRLTSAAKFFRTRSFRTLITIESGIITNSCIPAKMNFHQRFFY